MMTFIIVAAIAGITLTSGAPVYRNMGENGCINVKGETETCGYLQFCSQNEVRKGCRNCTDIYKEWCSVEANLDKFRANYPMCEILCQRDKLEEAKKKLDEMKKEVDRLTEENQTLKETNKQTKPGPVAAIGVLLLVVLVLASIVYKLWTKQDVGHSIANGTAHPENWKTSCLRMLRCFLSDKKPSPQQPVSLEAGGVDPTSQLLPNPPQASVSNVRAPESSDHGSISSTNSGSNTLNDVVVPSGGTPHHLDDTKDFMTHSQCARNGGGAAAVADISV